MSILLPKSASIPPLERTIQILTTGKLTLLQAAASIRKLPRALGRRGGRRGGRRAGPAGNLRYTFATSSCTDLY